MVDPTRVRSNPSSAVRGFQRIVPRLPRVRELVTLVLAAGVATVSSLYWPPERLGALKHAAEPFLSSEYLGYDELFAIRGPRSDDLDPLIVVIGFGRDSEELLHHRWPVPRRFHAQVIKNLAAAGAKVIAYDVLFSDSSDKEDDVALDKALKQAGNVVLTCRLERDPARRMVHMESPYYSDALGVDFEAKAKTGFAEVPQDDDNVVRAWNPAEFFQDQWIPSFSTATYLRMIGQPDAKILVSRTSVTLPGAVIPNTGSTSVNRVYQREVPSALLDFPAGQNAFDNQVTFYQAYLGKFPKNYLKGKVVFVGPTGTEVLKETGDKYATAYTNRYPDKLGGLSQKEIPGVFIQAHAFNAILKHAFVSELSPGWTWFYIFSFSFFGLAAVRRYTNWRAWVLFFGAMGGYQAMVIFMFIAHRIHAPYVLPLILMTLTTAIVAWLERGSIKRRWSSYVSPKVLDHILRAEGDLGAHRTHATVLFTDLRGFTSFSEGQNPERVIAILNDHFERITRFVDEEQGTLDKFMGDGLLAVFGAPIKIENPEWHAVRSAWHMWRASLEPVTHDGQRFSFKMSVGISTGAVVAGHVGSKRRHDFTVIGDPVNTASRLQALGREGGVQIDRATYDEVEPYVLAESLGLVEIRGKAVPMECFRVVEWSDTPIATKPSSQARPFEVTAESHG